MTFRCGSLATVRPRGQFAIDRDAVRKMRSNHRLSFVVLVQTDEYNLFVYLVED
jgi:hypothetical protein